MASDEEDLIALRTAVLASMSKEKQSEDCQDDDSDEDSELAALRAAALKTKKANDEKKDLSLDQGWGSSPAPGSPKTQGLGRGRGSLRIPMSVPWNQKQTKSANLIVIQTVPMEGEERVSQPRGPNGRGFKQDGHGRPPVGGMKPGMAAAGLVRPQDKWAASITGADSTSGTPPPKKTKSDKFSRYDSSNSEDEESDESNDESGEEDTEIKQSASDNSDNEAENFEDDESKSDSGSSLSSRSSSRSSSESRESSEKQEHSKPKPEPDTCGDKQSLSPEKDQKSTSVQKETDSVNTLYEVNNSTHTEYETSSKLKHGPETKEKSIPKTVIERSQSPSILSHRDKAGIIHKPNIDRHLDSSHGKNKYSKDDIGDKRNRERRKVNDEREVKDYRSSRREHQRYPRDPPERRGRYSNRQTERDCGRNTDHKSVPDRDSGRNTDHRSVPDRDNVRNSDHRSVPDRESGRNIERRSVPERESGRNTDHRSVPDRDSGRNIERRSVPDRDNGRNTDHRNVNNRDNGRNLEYRNIHGRDSGERFSNEKQRTESHRSREDRSRDKFSSEKQAKQSSSQSKTKIDQEKLEARRKKFESNQEVKVDKKISLQTVALKSGRTNKENRQRGQPQGSQLESKTKNSENSGESDFSDSDFSSAFSSSFFSDSESDGNDAAPWRYKHTGNRASSSDKYTNKPARVGFERGSLDIEQDRRKRMKQEREKHGKAVESDRPRTEGKERQPLSDRERYRDFFRQRRERENRKSADIIADKSRYKGKFRAVNNDEQSESSDSEFSGSPAVRSMLSIVKRSKHSRSPDPLLKSHPAKSTSASHNNVHKNKYSKSKSDKEIWGADHETRSDKKHRKSRKVSEQVEGDEFETGRREDARSIIQRLKKKHVEPEEGIEQMLEVEEDRKSSSRKSPTIHITFNKEPVLQKKVKTDKKSVHERLGQVISGKKSVTVEVDIPEVEAPKGGRRVIAESEVDYSLSSKKARIQPETPEKTPREKKRKERRKVKPIDEDDKDIEEEAVKRIKIMRRGGVVEAIATNDSSGPSSDPAPVEGEKELDARIQRIKENNMAILRRQQLIAADKKKYAT